MMLRKRTCLTLLLMALTLSTVAYPTNAALAVCNRTGGSGSNDIYACTNPPDTNGVSTGSGNDRITINADTTVSGSGITVDSGYGSDYIENRGTISARYDGIHLRDGYNDIAVNYGTINAQDDGVWCTPTTGHTCTIRNFGTITSVNESIDIYNRSGKIVILNTGRIQGGQETMHFHGPGVYEVDNRGYVESRRTGIEAYQGQVSIRNSGTLYSTGQNAVLLYTMADSLINNGTIKSDRTAAVNMHGGADVLQNTGTIEARNSSSGGAAVSMGPGDDRIITSGNVREMSAGYAAIALNDGNDILTIQGGQIRGRVYGNNGRDVLSFELSGSSSEIAAFRSRVNSQSPSRGSAIWRGNTYEWRQFEEIRMNLTVAAAPFDLSSLLAGLMLGNNS